MALKKIPVIVFYLLLVSCVGNEPNSHPGNAGNWIHVDNKDKLAEEIRSHNGCLIFITTDWCKGGALTFKNIAEPMALSLKSMGVNSYFIVLGKPENFSSLTQHYSDSSSFEIHHISGGLLSSPPVHRSIMKSFLKSIDSEYEYMAQVPVQVIYKNGKLYNVNGESMAYKLLKAEE